MSVNAQKQVKVQMANLSQTCPFMDYTLTQYKMACIQIDLAEIDAFFDIGHRFTL